MNTKNGLKKKPKRLKRRREHSAFTEALRKIEEMEDETK